MWQTLKTVFVQNIEKIRLKYRIKKKQLLMAYWIKNMAGAFLKWEKQKYCS